MNTPPETCTCNGCTCKRAQLTPDAARMQKAFTESYRKLFEANPELQPEAPNAS